MEREALIKNALAWRERIGNAAAKWGGAEICAVTKTVDVETINLIRTADYSIIGENRVQELMGKLDQLDPGFEKHLIGTLQVNKVKYLIGKVDMIQSLDREALAEEISRRAVNARTSMNVLVQVNIAREEQKGGVDETELEGLLERCAALPGLRVRGLMSIMPNVDDPEDVRPYFRRMRTLFERLRERDMKNISMDCLSMGMTHDCVVAAEEGATMVRLGRALFGERPQKMN